MSKEGFRINYVRYAFLLAGGWFVIASSWILLTSMFASSVAQTVQELERFEIMKGYGFMIISSILLFFFSLSLFRRVAASGQQLVRSQQRLVQAEREAITGLLASSVAHDFTNLLTVLRLNAERLRSANGLSDTSKDAVVRLDHAVSRLAELSQRLRSAGQSLLKDRPRTFNLSETINETLGFLEPHEAARNCEIDREIEASIQITGYPILIHQLLMNLVLNAAEATDGHGRILIRAMRERGATRIEVHDNGPGINPVLRSSVFDAFFTTKSHGTGLGLMSVKSCVDVHSGQIWVEDSPLGGAAFIAILPDLEPVRVKDVKLAEFLNKNESHPSPVATH